MAEKPKNKQKTSHPKKSQRTEEGHQIKPDIQLEDMRRAFLSGYGRGGTTEGEAVFIKTLCAYLKQEVVKHVCAKKYNIIILFDNTRMVKTDSDRIYNDIKDKGFGEGSKPLLLVLVSGGGELGSAYLIGQLCRELSNEKFIVTVPRHAKSAATLLACAADEIHMGSLSDLGPIDPQIDDMPALGLKHSIEHIVELVNKTPSSSDMFAKYLNLSIAPIKIGYYERVAKSAEQYAQKLLNSHKDTLTDSPDEIAKRLVRAYLDHGFVIDKSEAISIFSKKTVKGDTPEYELSNTVYEILSNIENLASVFGYRFYFMGSLDACPGLLKKRN